MIDKETQTISCDGCGNKRSLKQLRSRNGKKLTLFKMPDGRHLCYECRKMVIKAEQLKQLISLAAEASEVFDEDDLERFADNLNRREE